MAVLTLLLASTIAVGLSVDLPASTASDITSGDVAEGDSLQESLVVAEEPTAGAGDTDAEGDLEETFDADDISGVKTNDDDSDLTVTFDTGHELRDGDPVHLRYEAADNPDTAAETTFASGSTTLGGPRGR